MSRVVVALGGNALGNTPEEQRRRIDSTVPALTGLIRQGYEIVLSHGNGPQVGMTQLAFDAASKVNPRVAPMELAECTAMSQGYIGYHLQNGLQKQLRREKMPWQAATVVTRVEVEGNDPAFAKPTKPIGAFYTESEAEALRRAHPDWTIREDAGRGWRRMAASPKPVAIVERDAILALLDREFIVIACGGGGIPVVRRNGNLEGVSAVIDKDFASAALASAVNADTLVILTAVKRVALHFGTEEQRDLSEMTADEALQYCREGHFGAGSMLPKVEAAAAFVKGGERRSAVIAALEEAPLALSGRAGTRIS